MGTSRGTEINRLVKYAKKLYEEQDYIEVLRVVESILSVENNADALIIKFKVLSKNIEGISGLSELKGSFSEADLGRYANVVDGLSYFDKGDINKALEILTEEYVGIEGYANYLVNYIIGMIYFEKGDYCDAKKYLQICVVLHPDNKEIHETMLKLHNHLGEEQYSMIENEIINTFFSKQEPDDIRLPSTSPFSTGLSM